MIDAVRKRWKLSVCLILLVFALSVSSAFAQTETVLQVDFEKGIKNWEARGDGVSIKSDKEQAATGTKSLRVSGRSANWHGAQMNITSALSAGKTYKFTLSVKLAKGEADDEIKMTIQRGDKQFDGAGMTTASANGWTTFSGKYKCAGTDPYLLIYVEATRPKTAFSIDDLIIEAVSGDEIPAQSGVILQNDFEDMTAQNWITNGDGVQMFSSNGGGSQGLKVMGRTAPWNALALDISPLIFKGRTYLISISAKLLKGQTADSLKLTMRQTPPSGDPTYVEVSKLTPVTDREWVTISGQYTATTSNNNLLIYVESAGATTSFYIDNFVIKVP